MKVSYPIIYLPANATEEAAVPTGALVVKSGETEVKFKAAAGIESVATSSTVAGAVAAITINDWQAATPVVLNEMRRATATAGTIELGDLIRSNSARTTGATFDATEAGNWTEFAPDIVTQAALDAALLLKANVANPTMTGVILLDGQPVLGDGANHAQRSFSDVIGVASVVTNTTGTNATTIANTDIAARFLKPGTAGTKSNATMDIIVGSHTAGGNANTQVDFRLGNAGVNAPDTTVMSLRSDGTMRLGADVVGALASTTPAMDGTAAVGTGATSARADHVHPTDTSRAPLADPTFTGVPEAPTPAVDTNTTQLATTAFVNAQLSGTLPVMNGTATVGSGTRSCRGNHVHPTDTSRAPLASPVLTGTPQVSGDPKLGSNSGHSQRGFSDVTGAAMLMVPATGTAASTIATTDVAARFVKPGTAGTKANAVFDIVVGSHTAGIAGATQVDLRLANASTNLPDTTVMSLRGDGTISMAGRFSSAFNGCRASVSVDTTATTAVNLAIPFATETYDTNTYHDNVTNNTRLTAPVAGYYRIGATVEWMGNATGRRTIGYRVNGGAVVWMEDIPVAAIASTLFQSFTTEMNLAAASYVEIVALQTSGGNLNVMNASSFATISFIGT